MRAIEIFLVPGMAILAVVVQIGVYGATKIRSGPGPLGAWMPYFGLTYGVIFAAVLLAYCHFFRRPRGYIFLGVTWALYTALSLFIALARHAPSGSHDLGSQVALGAGLGALVLWGAYHTDRL